MSVAAGGVSIGPSRHEHIHVTYATKTLKLKKKKQEGEEEKEGDSRQLGQEGRREAIQAPLDDAKVV